MKPTRTQVDTWVNHHEESVAPIMCMPRDVGQCTTAEARPTIKKGGVAEIENVPLKKSAIVPRAVMVSPNRAISLVALLAFLLLPGSIIVAAQQPHFLQAIRDSSHNVAAQLTRTLDRVELGTTVQAGVRGAHEYDDTFGQRLALVANAQVATSGGFVGWWCLNVGIWCDTEALETECSQ